MKPIRIIIAGGRDFTDRYQMGTELWNLFGGFKPGTWERFEVVCGMARGADLLGKDWANMQALGIKEMPADWDKYGKSAGHIRNHEMAVYAAAGNPYGYLIVFWDGKSTGTESMINVALSTGLEIHVFRYDSEDQ